MIRAPTITRPGGVLPPGGGSWQHRQKRRTEDGKFADRLNSLPKYVVSSTLKDPKWTNVTVLEGNVVDEITTLKQHVDGDIVIYASYQLGRTLIGHDLVDELRLFIFPVVVGAGERLFGKTSGTKPFRLAGSRTAGDGLVYVSYEIARDAQRTLHGAVREDIADH